jgi:hypothetical protein
MALVIQVQWHWGGRTSISTFSHEIIGEVLSDHGFSVPDGATLFVAHRGRLIDPRFSFLYYRVQSNDLFVCLAKPSAPPPAFCNSIFSITFEQWENGRLAEDAKLKDLSFAGWESHPSFPLILRDLMSEIEGEREAEECFPTVLAAAPRISETPLPPCFRKDRCGEQAGARIGRALGFRKGKLS